MDRRPPWLPRFSHWKWLAPRLCIAVLPFAASACTESSPVAAFLVPRSPMVVRGAAPDRLPPIQEAHQPTSVKPHFAPPKPPIVQEKQPAPAPAPAEPEPAAQELRLVMTFTQRTWIQISADGVLRFDGFKQPGETYEISAEETLELYTGNAGGFSFTLNGRPGLPLGQPGTVVRDLVITWDNYQDYVGNQ